jgi:hypothetical protein
MTVAIADLGEKIAELAVNAICNHPSVIGWGLGVFVVATLVNTGIKFTWTYAETPRWARFILGVTMPLALNFYHFGEKIGITQPSAPNGTISPSAIADALKRDVP